MTTINKKQYLFLKTKNKMFSKNIFELFSIIFSYFLRAGLKNNYSITKNNSK